MNDPVRKEMKQLTQDFAGLRSDIGRLSEVLATAGANRGRTLYQRAADRGVELGHRGEAALDSVHQSIRNRPLGTTLAVIGIGCVIGLLVASCAKSFDEGK
ncbi:hypothetical protein [Kineobactrum salinum]|uniref:DUF883 family protein n=1 Tax=Kineobactrum salinum TaxID=2708301 RepID=A0A6C0U9B9_9GAMM|nr:hypothetical protein [Kineobactrum salinum]QIB67225.1 hypothetical protein G3T16_19255 [Kineobactrum salinum]